jgi:hypothetical protein
MYSNRKATWSSYDYCAIDSLLFPRFEFQARVLLLAQIILAINIAEDAKQR